MGNFQSFRIGFDDQPKRDPNRKNPYLQVGPGEVAGFSSNEEFMAALRDPRYSAAGQDGEDFREAVKEMLKNSDLGTSHNAKAAAQRRTDWRTEEDRQILREHIQTLMNDPKYETSALFRRQVREQIEKNPGLFETAMPQGTKIKARIQLGEEDRAEVRKVLDEEKKTAREEAKKAAVAEAERRAAAPYIDALSGEAQDE
jgi:hypothetical protein